MRILVTGGAGFIGSHFIRYTLENDPDSTIVNVDHLTYAAHPKTSAFLKSIAPARYSFYQTDIASPDMEEILSRGNFNAIVNFAAETHVDRSILEPSIFIRTNVLGVQNLLHLSRKYGNIRFVQVSTDEVYGSLSSSQLPSTEDSKLSPNSPYSASKAAADLLAMACYRTYGHEVLVTRCTNNFGPFQFPEKLLPLVITNALQDLPIPVYGDGLQIRDWIYVIDHCQAIDLILRGGRAGEVYNISASQETRNLDLIKMVLDRIGKPHSLIHFVGDRPAHDRRYALDSAKIEEELSWKPHYSLSDGLAETISWYRSHESWWRDLRDLKYQDYYRSNYDSKFQSSDKGSHA